MKAAPPIQAKGSMTPSPGKVCQSYDCKVTRIYRLIFCHWRQTSDLALRTSQDLGALEQLRGSG